MRDPKSIENARNLALAQNNLGLLIGQNGQATEAIKLLASAHDSQIKLSSADPNSRELAADLATTHSNLGLIQQQTGQRKAAKTEFSAAIQIGEHLAADSGTEEVILRTLAAGYNNLASLQDEAHLKQASEAYQKAIALQTRLVKADPINRIYQAELARTYNNLGFLSTRVKDWKKAELCYGDAIRLQEELVKASPLAARIGETWHSATIISAWH